MKLIPTLIEPYSSTELKMAWNDHQEFAIPYVEVRFFCPCASCIDEHTGERTIQKSSIHPEIRPKSVQLVGKYAVQIHWNDGHDTGMFHYDRLREICEKQGKRTTAAAVAN